MMSYIGILTCHECKGEMHTERGYYQRTSRRPAYAYDDAFEKLRMSLLAFTM